MNNPLTKLPWQWAAGVRDGGRPAVLGADHPCRELLGEADAALQRQRRARVGGLWGIRHGKPGVKCSADMPYWMSAFALLLHNKTFNDVTNSTTLTS